MTLTKFVNATVADATEVNDNFNSSITLSGLNTIRGLIDRAGVWGLGMMDFWGDAYIDSNGRENSVNTTYPNTNTIFNTDRYSCGFSYDASGDINHDPNSFTNTSNAFDDDTSTFANKLETNLGGFNISLGKTFSSKYVGWVRIYASEHGGFSGQLDAIYLETYNGSTWDNIATLVSGTTTARITFNGHYFLNSTVQGVRVRLFAADSNADDKEQYVYELNYGDSIGTTIEHNIPTGTFSSTIDSVIGIPLISDWETGADIQYKLTNATEDTGWLNSSNSPEISTFTSFTSEPTKLIVKLIPKVSTPTAGYPSIKGFVVKAE